jgi:hypothetical protein
MQLSAGRRGRQRSKPVAVGLASKWARDPAQVRDVVISHALRPPGNHDPFPNALPLQCERCRSARGHVSRSDARALRGCRRTAMVAKLFAGRVIITTAATARASPASGRWSHARPAGGAGKHSAATRVLARCGAFLCQPATAPPFPIVDDVAAYLMPSPHRNAGQFTAAHHPGHDPPVLRAIRGPRGPGQCRAPILIRFLRGSGG